MPELNYDLHIHSCLSPCGDDDMTPANIVGMAVIKGLDLIAVTDHNSCKNCPAVLTMADAYGLTALPGMELTTSEEVHVVCLFADLKDALAFDEYVYSRLMPIPNNIEYPGTMTEHIHYEAQLKVDFREFVQKMKEKHAHFQEVNMQSADEICTFIRKCHEEYLHAVKSVENDCRYILQICAQVVGAILHLLQQNSMPLGCYM